MRRRGLLLPLVVLAAPACLRASYAPEPRPAWRDLPLERGAPDAEAPPRAPAEPAEPETEDAGGDEPTADAPAGAADPAPDVPLGRRVIPARNVPGSDTLPITRRATDFTLENVELQASPRAALLFFDHQGPHRGTRLRDVLIHVAPGTLPLDRAYWGLRGYDLVDTVLERVEVTGFGRVTEKHDEGHAVYVNPAGDLTVVDCFLHHNGGQALQLVNRPRETDLPRGPMPGTVRVERTRVHENGFNPDRGGFQVSIFGTGQAVVLRDVEILAGLDDTSWPGERTGGGLVIEPEAYAPDRNKLPWWRPAKPPEDFVPPFTQERVELERVRIRHRNPTKPLAQLKGCRELIVRGCTFEAVIDDAARPGTEGKVVLDAPDKPGRTSGRIVWEGNRGNAVVYLRGERLGPVSEDFVVEPVGPPEAGEGEEAKEDG